MLNFSKVKCLILPGLTCFASIAGAAPVLTPIQHDSAFIVIASNDEDKRYNCSIAYSWWHRENTTPKQVQEVVNVLPNAKNVEVHAIRAGIMGMQVSNYRTQCFPV